MTYRCGSCIFVFIALACMILNGCGGGAQSPGSSASSSSNSSSVASLSASSLNFPSQTINATSATQSLTFTNAGSTSISLNAVVVTGNFAQSNNCGATLAAGASCTVNVTFTPTAVGVRTGTVSFTDNAPQSPQVVSLAGTGETGGQLVAGPSSISFGNVTIGQTGSQSVTITNSCEQDISVTSVSTSGAGVGVSGISTPLTLAPNQSTTFTVTFDPSSSGSVSGAIYLTNSSATGNLTIPTTGTGTTTPTAPSPQVFLSWNASSSPVIGYDTYRGSVSGGPYTKLTSSPIAQTSYTDQDVTAGDTYYYVVTSVGTNLVESAFSNEAKATVPTP